MDKFFCNDVDEMDLWFVLIYVEGKVWFCKLEGWVVEDDEGMFDLGWK